MLSPDNIYDNMSGQNCVFGNNTNNIDNEVIFLHDIKKWLVDEDPRVIEMVELIYFHDYSVKAAAEIVGLSGAGANMKLKDLSKNK
jgi:hypothetical protein